MKQQYTEDKKSETLAYFAATGENQRRTSRDCNVPLGTLQRWIKGGGTNEAVTAKALIKKGELADRLEALAHLLVDAMPEKMVEATLKDTAVALGVSIDKMQLLRNKPTSITDDLSSVTDTELDRRIAALERGEIQALTESATALP